MTSDEGHYAALAAAFVRGRLGPDPRDATDEETMTRGLAAGLRLHRFKRTAGLLRVRKVIGMLRALLPGHLLDVGSGRGAFLWPLLDAFPSLRVTAVDLLPHRVADIAAVGAGGFPHLSAARMDAAALALADRAVDGVTLLEVLEHLPAPARAIAEALRVARRFVIASVPSHEDDNPEHLHLFDPGALEAQLLAAGARRVAREHVLNHTVLLATL